eukprot:UN05381
MNKEKKLDAEHKSGGQRDWSQVLTNSYLGVITAIWYWSINGSEYKAIDLTSEDQILGSQLSLANMAFYAACTGDTWSSEIGVLAKGKPYLITQCRAVT